MKITKRICALLLALNMSILICQPTFASDDTVIIIYKIYDQNDNFVEEGFIPTNSNAKINWSGFSLQSGYYVNLRSNSNAFLFDNGDSMTLKYTLASSGTITTRFMKTSTSTGTGSVWSSTTRTGSSGTISKTADETTYYYPRMSNTGSNTITVTSVSFN